MIQNYLLSKKLFKYLKYPLVLKLIMILLFIFSPSMPNPVLVSTCNAEEISSSDLTDLSIQDLMEIEITTGAKKSQILANTSAAAFVITQEDIRRSGVTSIAEALRMVPGLQVARIDANKWAISSRGFNSRYSNKLLVLMDGRTVYSPLFSGVFWDIQDTPLEDIDRIEIIRGPGAALWGANAVNGVINIITKSAYDTKGGLVSAGAGKEERGFGTFRYGDSIGEKASYRFFGKYTDRDGEKLSSGGDAADDWNIYILGFRSDWNPTAMDSLMFEGNHFGSDEGQRISMLSLSAPYSSTFDESTKSDGENFLFRWKRILSNTSDMELQVYHDRVKFQQTVVGSTTKTYDFDFQHRFSPCEKHEIIWGLGYRVTNSDTKSSFMISFDPKSCTNNLYSAFVQDDITIVEDYFRVTLGAKIEHNEYTGYEFQSNIRTLWTPDKNNSIWASWSRAVRTPSISERGVRTNLSVLPPGIPQNPSSLPLLISDFTGDNFNSEILYAYEIGYRNQISKSISTDITAFYNKYNDLRSANIDYNATSLELSPLPPHMVVPVFINNNAYGHTYGLEVSAEWKPFLWWAIKPAYSFLHMNLKSKPLDISLLNDIDTAAPRHQISCRSFMDLPMDLELDLWLRYVDELSSIDISRYCMLDARLGWKATKNLEISLVGQNLSDKKHLEFSEEFLNLNKTETERAFYLEATWYF